MGTEKVKRRVEKSFARAVCCLALGFAVLFAAAESCGAEEMKATPIQYVTEKDIAYYPGQSPSDVCRMDLYYPEGVEDFPTVVWLHAGGLNQGNRYFPGELKNQGIAIAAVDYRKYPEAKAPDFIEDAAAAVAWVFKNIEKRGGSRQKIFVTGASAGGYLASMVGLDRSWLAVHGVEADNLAGIVALGGQAITHVAVREEKGGNRMRPVIDSLAPLYYVRPDAPPYLLVTGDRELELLGRYEENAYMARMMKLAGHKETRLIELKGRDHAGVERPGHAYLLEFVKDNAK